MNRDTQGAEAIITVNDGAVTKDRIQKQYRQPDLDERLRTERTDREARLLRKAAQAGVRVPAVEAVRDTALTMEWIDGTVLREVLDDNLGNCAMIGESIARLHNNDIIHGDLTTSNMIRADDDVYFIDFGLGFFSQRIEDRAVDLHLLKDVLDSTHTAVADEAMDRILSAYWEHADDAAAVMERYEEIAERGRYK